MSSPLQELSPPRTPARSLTIVVADDVLEIQELLATWLEDDGHVVVRAGTGREALRAIHERAVDLLVTDILMPDGDGLDAIMALVRTRPSTRILAISGGGRAMTADTCLSLARGLGAHGVLLKPFNRAQFAAAMQGALRG